MKAVKKHVSEGYSFFSRFNKEGSLAEAPRSGL